MQATVTNAIMGKASGSAESRTAGQAGHMAVSESRSAQMGKMNESTKIARDPQQTPRLPDDAIVCRGGTCTAGRFLEGAGVTLDQAGKLQNVSVNSAPGKTLTELTVTLPNR